MNLREGEKKNGQPLYVRPLAKGSGVGVDWNFREISDTRRVKKNIYIYIFVPNAKICDFSVRLYNRIEQNMFDGYELSMRTTKYRKINLNQLFKCNVIKCKMI